MQRLNVLCFALFCSLSFVHFRTCVLCVGVHVQSPPVGMDGLDRVACENLRFSAKSTGAASAATGAVASVAIQRRTTDRDETRVGRRAANREAHDDDGAAAADVLPAGEVAIARAPLRIRGRADGRRAAEAIAD